MSYGEISNVDPEKNCVTTKTSENYKVMAIVLVAKDCSDNNNAIVITYLVGHNRFGFFAVSGYQIV